MWHHLYFALYIHTYIIKYKLLLAGRKYRKTSAVVSLRIINEDDSDSLVLVYMCLSCKLRLNVFLIVLLYNDDSIVKIPDEMR